MRWAGGAWRSQLLLADRSMRVGGRQKVGNRPPHLCNAQVFDSSGGGWGIATVACRSALAVRKRSGVVKKLGTDRPNMQRRSVRGVRGRAWYCETQVLEACGCGWNIVSAFVACKTRVVTTPALYLYKRLRPKPWAATAVDGAAARYAMKNAGQYTSSVAF